MLGDCAGCRGWGLCQGLSWVPCLALPGHDSLTGMGSGWPISRSARNTLWLTGWGLSGESTGLGELGRVPGILGSWEVPGQRIAGS